VFHDSSDLDLDLIDRSKPWTAHLGSEYLGKCIVMESKEDGTTRKKIVPREVHIDSESGLFVLLHHIISDSNNTLEEILKYADPTLSFRPQFPELAY
jgi:hypothetical protein